MSVEPIAPYLEPLRLSVHVKRPVADAFEAVEAYEPYIAARLAEGHRLHAMTRHMLGLFTGRPGARAYRRHLATEAIKPEANLQTLRDAVSHVSRASRLESAA